MTKEVEQCDHRAVDAQANSQSNPLAAETPRTGRLPPHEYLHRFNHEPNPYCDHCGTGSIEDAEHALFICPLYLGTEPKLKRQPFVT